MASTSELRIYSALFSTTLDDHSAQLADNVFAGIPYLWYMMNRGRGRDRGSGRGIRFQNGGARVKVPVIWAQNSNAMSYSKYESLAVNPTDSITVTIEDLAQLAVTVGISGEEMDQNQGLAAKRDLLRDKVDIAEMSLKEMVETQLVQGTPTGDHFTAGNSGKDMLPLGWLIQSEDQATTAASVHGIDQVAEDWWRNRVTPSAAGSAVAFRGEMTNLYNQCSRGSTQDHPDLGVTDQTYYEKYEADLMAQQRYGNYGDDGVASAGFEAVKFKGMMMFWSEFMPNFGPAGTPAATVTQSTAEAVAFFLNTRWLELVISRQLFFKSTDFIEPYDQDAIWAKILFRGQHTVKQRRKQGLHYGVDTTSW